MSALTLSLVAFACIFGGTLLGMGLRTLLPEHHLSDETKDTVRLGTGMIATLAALVLGLLIASAKGTHDTMGNELRETASKLVLLDRVMAQYGPETTEARDLLRSGIRSAMQRIWPEELHKVDITKTRHPGNEFDILQDKLRFLTPSTDAQRWVQTRALQVSEEIAEARWLLLTRVGQSALPVPFLVVLICWLTAIFASFGLFSPWNGTALFVLLICSVSAAAALFLMAEMDQPYKGIVKISSEPLRNALVVMEQ